MRRSNSRPNYPEVINRHQRPPPLLPTRSASTRMSREELHLRDRLLQLSECPPTTASSKQPFNVKRKSLLLAGKQASTKSSSSGGGKLSMQDFVRMDPGYTPDIEHLVFPSRNKRNNPQQVAPTTAAAAPPPTKTRSRLAEMFALSRHLQQRSADREAAKTRHVVINRSVDSVLDNSAAVAAGLRSNETVRRWVSSADEPVRQNSIGGTRLSPPPDSDKSRGPNVSVLHLRSTSEPWEASQTTTTTTTSAGGRPYFTRSTTTTKLPPPPLQKHQSLGAAPIHNKWTNSPSFHSGGEVNSPDIFVGKNSSNCHRELSPVRWCDREVDGVYLGKSGWVQVQQRSLDDNRRASYTTPPQASSLQSRRTAIKLADYHCNSEPGKLEGSKLSEVSRPVYLSLSNNQKEFEGATKRLTPSPQTIPIESFSPPSLTPIISPPPAFQDRTKPVTKSRTFFGKTPFLPRSNAIEDSDASPPSSPKPVAKQPWKTFAPQPRKAKPLTIEPVQKPAPLIAASPRIPQTKSLEDTTATRRTQFVQRYGESSSSSSSSMGFRSLDSNLARPTMPRLSENTDSSIDVYEDADDEDNNSSSINISMLPIVPPQMPQQSNQNREKVSPSSRTSSRLAHHRAPPIRRSPAGSDSNKPTNSPSSSSTSSNEFLSRSPPPQQQPIRRSAPPRQTQFNKPLEDQVSSRVRRSRSLQLPERKPPTNFRVSPRISPQEVRGKIPNKHRGLEEEMLREAEVVTGFLYGNRSRAAAQALLMHRYNNNLEPEESAKPTSNGAGVTVYYVGNSSKERQRLLLRGSTSPNLGAKPQETYSSNVYPTIQYDHAEAQYVMMRSSQSYPTHQRSLDSTRPPNRYATPPPPPPRRLSPQPPPPHPKRVYGNANSGGSSSGSDAFLTPNSKSPKGTTKGSGASTPLEEDIPNIIHDDFLEKPSREIILTRPGSAPATEDHGTVGSGAQQRSMSLPKSFLSANYQPSAIIQYHNQGNDTSNCRRRGTESLGCSPGFTRKIPTPEASQTAPVTPLHESGRRRSPVGVVGGRRPKSSSTPQLLEATVLPTSTLPPPPPPLASNPSDNRKWSSKHLEDGSEFSLNPGGAKELSCRRNLPAHTSTESVLQKFRKTFSLRFQKKPGPGGAKENCMSLDMGGEGLQEMLGEMQGSEEDSPQHVASTSSSTGQIDSKEETTEQKHKFGPLIWRGSKERKKLNKAARNAKCNSGDSGIQIEMVPSCAGSGGVGGDSSESHDTDPPGDELDSPPPVRRRRPPLHHSGKASRPHSDLLNQILIDKFKADLKQRSHKHQQVRRTRSDLGGQRLLHWDARSSFRRLMSSPAPLRTRPQSPRKKPPDIPDGGVQLRNLPQHRRGLLRRSLSQPLDIDKLSPLMRIKIKNLHHQTNNGAVLSEDGMSDDEMMSDSESSIASLSERKKSLELAMDEEMVILAEAVFDHVAFEAEELAFRAGDVIEVLETNNREWWWGSAKGKIGWFPAQFVRLRVSQEDTVEDCLAAMAAGQTTSSQIRRRTSISLLSNDQVRTSVVRELVHTERDFVKVLQDVAEGYISECRKRTDMFTKDQIATIFINLEEILVFQGAFLKDLEGAVNWEEPYKSCVGGCFLRHSEGFKMYSDYCNSHPLATATLQELYEFNNYSKFFEACRLMRGLIEIPLDGYLLTPVQRICKYPLQLAELLKYTKTDHQDYEDIKQALEAMRDVAMLINERKRRMESLEKLAAWQQRVEGWEGDDLIELSSQLIYQGEVVRVTTGMWTNNITLFLFDHQIVYCKKDILKRNTYVYKGRIRLDTCEIIDVPDGKDQHLGVSVRHAIKLHSCVRDKWLLFCCRSSNDKQRWLRVFAEERRLVAQDKDDGLEFPPAARQLARLAARCQKRPPRKPRNGKNYKHDSGYMGGSTLQLNSGSASNSLGRKMGTWFTFGGNKKSRHHQHEVS